MLRVGKKNILGISLITLTAGAVIGLVVAAKFDLSPNGDASVADIDSGGIVSLENAFVSVAEDVGPAVVSISTVQISKPGTRRHYFGSPFQGPERSPFGDDFMERFFEDFFGDMPERERRQAGLGSGFIIDQRGYILTNQHVVEDADKITVRLPDGREFEAEMKGTDPRSDLAVIKINAKKLPSVKLGDSDDVKIGQWVIAIGNPFGYIMHSPEPTITTGVISALHRSLPRTTARDRDYSDLIQTDAAINPGNSGGPLVNIRGEVVGINVAIFSTTGGYQGIGFAIPVNSAKRIINKLIEGKKVLYGWLGVSVQDLNEDLTGYFGLENKEGVLVGKVFKDSPAEKAGIESGDIILKFDGNTIKDLRELLKYVGRTEVGTKVEAVLWRDKKQLTLNVEVGERPDDLGETTEEATETKGWRGITVEDLTPENRSRLRTDAEEGVVVVDVDADSPAAEAGIRAGAVIDEINRTPITSVVDFNTVTEELKGDILIRVEGGYVLVKEE
ncbi:Do family serine endopeptidase [Candidatus Omnitrophota bacterium]